MESREIADRTYLIAHTILSANYHYIMNGNVNLRNLHGSRLKKFDILHRHK
jgi:hypothetical protein